MMKLPEELVIWPFGLAVSFGLAAMIVVSIFMARSSRRVRAGEALCAMAWALPFALVGARLTWCAINYTEYILGTPARIVEIGDGGFSLWGGLLTGLLAAGMYCRAADIRKGDMMDALTPGFLVLIAIIRLAEPLAGQGIGKVMQADWLHLPFFAVVDDYGFARFAVWRYEAAAALFVALTALIRRTEKQRPGELFRTAITEAVALQLVLESLRDDDYLHISFVRISQIICALILLGTLMYYLSVCVHCRRSRAVMPLFLLFAAGAALVVRQEFAVDSLEYLELNYLIMLGGAMVVLASIKLARRSSEAAREKRKQRRQRRALR